MKRISEMNIEELSDLNKETLSAAELHEIEEHELVTSFENIGFDGNQGELYRIDITLVNGSRIDVYGDIDDIRNNW